jgi:enoyl-CoA hydratase
MRTGLEIGQIGVWEGAVDAGMAIHLGAGSAAGGAVVLSTPAMIKLLELAARDALRPYLESDEESVGVEIGVSHTAATPIGASVHGEARVTAVAERQVEFELTAHDAVGEIGRGKHRRAIIKLDRFGDRLKTRSHSETQSVALGMNDLQPNRGVLPALTTIRVEHDRGIACITLNRPRSANAVNLTMTADWEQLIAWLAGHPDEVRVVIVTGEGEHFCAGDDVKEVATLSSDAARQLSWRQAQMYLGFERLPQPMIAAVNGAALGAGCVCAYSCDFRLASTAARFGMPEIKLGWPPGYGIAQLTAIVGKARALEMCLTGEAITAQQAAAYGLVHQVLPLQRLMPAARMLAVGVVARPP